MSTHYDNSLNMGRKSVRVNVSFQPEVLSYLNKLCKELKMTRSAVLAFMLQASRAFDSVELSGLVEKVVKSFLKDMKK